MSSVRMVAIVFEGTLLNSRWRVPEANVRAIVEATRRGIDIVLVTGRRFDFAKPVFDLLPCDIVVIVNNGALIKTRDGRTLRRCLLPSAVAAHVLGGTRDFRDGAALVFDRAREGQVVFEAIDWNHPNRRGYAERNRDFIWEVAPLERALVEDPIQVMFNGAIEPMRELRATLGSLPGSDCFSVAATEYEARDFALVDVLAAGCSKGMAIREWAATREIEIGDVMAIGDNLNDREMLESVGHPVVMGNAVPALLASGWRVTLSNDDAGVAAVLDDILR